MMQPGDDQVVAERLYSAIEEAESEDADIATRGEAQRTVGSEYRVLQQQEPAYLFGVACGRHDFGSITRFLGFVTAVGVMVPRP
jgi:hypothetical protein